MPQVHGPSLFNKPLSLFLALPPEVRNCIYDAGLEWPDLPGLAKGISAKQSAIVDRPLCTIPRPHFGSMSTPPLLLLNRQITSEALEILYQKPFIMDSTPPYIPQLAKPMDITEFISESTLQNLRFVILKMNLNHKPNLMSGGAKGWLKTVEMLLDIWFVKNNLERVEVHVTYTAPSRDLVWTFEVASHHRQVMTLFSIVVFLKHISK
jgi:hypothetical protein